MNVFGAATQGKSVEKKTVAETFLAGHGSPFVAQVSIANAPKLYQAMLDALEYRGTAFLQCFTTCQPEHGVADDMSLDPGPAGARLARHAGVRLQPPRRRDLSGGARPQRQPRQGPGLVRDAASRRPAEPYRYTVAHWCATEARFRNHLKKIKPEEAEKLVPLENMLVRLTQNDVVYRRHLDPAHRAYVPDFGVFIKVQIGDKVEHRAISRQLVLFCVERRKAWRLLQSKAGIVNRDYKAQRAILADVDAGRIPKEELFARAEELMRERTEPPLAAGPKASEAGIAPAPAPPAPPTALPPGCTRAPRMRRRITGVTGKRKERA